MRPFVLGAALLLLAGCVVYERRPYVGAGGGSLAAARTAISEDEAVDVAFQLCQDRSLRVDRVERARLDASGRWHVTLAGFADRAQMLLDGRDGKLLKGRFHRDDTEPPAGLSVPPNQPLGAQPPRPSPPPPPPSPPDGELD